MEKEVKVSKMIHGMLAKIGNAYMAIFAICVVVLLAVAIFKRSGNIHASAIVIAVVVAVGVIFAIASTLFAFAIYRMDKDMGMAREYEDELFEKRMEKKRLANEYAELYKLLKLSGADLEAQAAARIKITAVMNVGSRVLRLSAPWKKYAGHDLMGELFAEKKRIEKKINGIVLPEKSSGYRKWERYFGLDEIQAA